MVQFDAQIDIQMIGELPQLTFILYLITLFRRNTYFVNLFVIISHTFLTIDKFFIIIISLIFYIILVQISLNGSQILRMHNKNSSKHY